MVVCDREVQEPVFHRFSPKPLNMQRIQPLIFTKIKMYIPFLCVYLIFTFIS